MPEIEADISREGNQGRFIFGRRNNLVYILSKREYAGCCAVSLLFIVVRFYWCSRGRVRFINSWFRTA